MLYQYFEGIPYLSTILIGFAIPYLSANINFALVKDPNTIFAYPISYDFEKMELMHWHISRFKNSRWQYIKIKFIVLLLL